MRSDCDCSFHLKSDLVVVDVDVDVGIDFVVGVVDFVVGVVDFVVGVVGFDVVVGFVVVVGIDVGHLDDASFAEEEC